MIPLVRGPYYAHSSNVDGIDASFNSDFRIDGLQHWLE